MKYNTILAILFVCLTPGTKAQNSIQQTPFKDGANVCIEYLNNCGYSEFTISFDTTEVKLYNVPPYNQITKRYKAHNNKDNSDVEILSWLTEDNSSDIGYYETMALILFEWKNKKEMPKLPKEDYERYWNKGGQFTINKQRYKKTYSIGLIPNPYKPIRGMYNAESSTFDIMVNGIPYRITK